MAAGAALRIEDYVGEPPAFDIRELASVAASVANAEKFVFQQRQRLADLLLKAETVTPAVIQVIAADMLSTEHRQAGTLTPMMRDVERKLDALLRSTRSHSADQKAFMRTVQRFLDAMAAVLEDLRDARVRLLLLASEKARDAGSPDVEITSDDDLDRYFQDVTGR